MHYTSIRSITEIPEMRTRVRAVRSFPPPCHPTPTSVQVPCKAVMVFFHYCVMSNYFWLFIEGLYLFTLLVETFFPERRYFYWYTIVGWGECLFQMFVYWYDYFLGFSSLQHVNNWLYYRNSHHLCNCLGSPEAPFPWHWVKHLIF